MWEECEAVGTGPFSPDKEECLLPWQLKPPRGSQDVYDGGEDDVERSDDDKEYTEVEMVDEECPGKEDSGNPDTCDDSGGVSENTFIRQLNGYKIT